MRIRAIKPIRRGVVMVPPLTTVDVVVPGTTISPPITGTDEVVTVPLAGTTVVSRISGTALEVPALTGAGATAGMGAGTVVAGTVIMGSAGKAALVVNIGLVFRARIRASRPIR